MPPREKNLVLSMTIIVSSLYLAAPAKAQELSNPTEISAVYACKSLTDDLARLACYDKAVGSLEAAVQKGDVVTVSKSAIKELEKDAFGFNIPSLPSLGKLFGGGNKKATKKNDLTDPVKKADVSSSPKSLIKPPAIQKPKPSEIKEVNLVIRKTTEFGRKKTRFFMTNGQIWEQVGTTRSQIRKLRNGETNTAEISKAALGSFFLKVNGKGASIRVKRVR